MFGRRKKDGAPVEDETDELDQELEAEEIEQAAPPPLVRPQGPWDVEDVPDGGVNRVDLGALRIPVQPETEVRVDVGPEGQVVAASLVRGPSSMQVNAFAAPRSYGIWAEVREEIGAALRDGGGRADEQDGPWGVELRADIPGAGDAAPSTARFVGVDGPRWFLRALLTGPAATDPTQAGELEAALRDIVVVRGSEAMAVRGPLPLRLPEGVTRQPPPPSAGAAPPAADPPEPEASEPR